MTCKLIIKINTKIFVQGFTAMKLIFLTQRCQSDQMTGGTRQSQEVTSDCFIFFCTSLHVWIHGATTSNSCFNFMHQPKNFKLKEMIKSSTIFSPLSESWDLPQQHQNFLNCLIYVVWSIAQGPPWCMQCYESQKIMGINQYQICFRPKFLPQNIHSCGLQPIHGPLYFHYAVREGAGFLAFTYITKVPFSHASKILQKVQQA